MVQELTKCPVCGKKSELLPSNNPLVQPTCNDCVNSQLKYNSLEDGDFFCRTYDFPFRPEL